MSKKVVNLGKVKGRTLDLKVEDNIIKKKYDDEAEWEDLVEVPDAGVSVVDTVNDLPTDAKEDSVAFVKNEAFVETIERQEEIPIVSEGGEHILNFELKQDMIQFSGDNLKDIHPELSDENSSISLACEIETSDDSIDIEYYHYPPAAANEWLGVNHSIDLCMFETYEADGSFVRWINLKGMSAKDFAVEVMGLPLPDAYLQILCGEHYGDETADNPSYGWVKQYETSYPLNENSLPVNSIYATIVYDAVVDCKFTGMLDRFRIETYDSNGEEDIYFYENLAYPDDKDPEEFATALSYANTFTNFLFRGGIKHISQDIYEQKGFHIYENEKWKSLEEKMNIPKVVEKHSDLPKSFIENGIMVVANEEIVGQPTTKLEASVPVSIKINPTPSVKDEIEKLKQHFVQKGFPTDTNWDNFSLNLDGQFVNEIGEDIGTVWISSKLSDNDFNGIEVTIKKSKAELYDYYIYEHYYYFDEAGAEIYVPGERSNNTISTTYTTDEGKCWYCMECEYNGKTVYLHTPPRKVEFDDWFELSKYAVNCELYIESYEVGVENFDEFELTSYEFASLLKVYDSRNDLIYPKGFYMYARNYWWHQPEIDGSSFDNVDVLRTITKEDVGNFHSHNNQSALDSITDYFLQSTTECNYRSHYHDNLFYLDQIKNSNQIHIHDNKTALDKITEEHLHYHNNKTFLDELSETYINNIASDKSLWGYEYRTVNSLTNPNMYDLSPNKFYHFRFVSGGSSSPGMALYLKNKISNKANEYHFAISMIDSGGISIYDTTEDGSNRVTYIGETPIFEGGYRYEFSVLDGIAIAARTPL